MSIVFVTPLASDICDAMVILKISSYSLYSSLSSLYLFNNSSGVLNFSPDGLIAS